MAKIDLTGRRLGRLQVLECHVERLPDVAGEIEQLLEGEVARLKQP